MRRDTAAILAAALLAAAAAEAAAEARSERTAAPATAAGAVPGLRVRDPEGYPKLAMWWPDTATQGAAELSRYGWLGLGPWDSPEALAAIKALNPSQLHFMSCSMTETGSEDYRAPGTRELMSAVPAEWFLTQRGSRLARPANATDAIVHLERVEDEDGNPLFEAGDAVVAGGETMRVLAVDGRRKALRVERGYCRAASAHPAGRRVAAHATFWPGTWTMDLSASCPLADAGRGPERWSDWAVDVYLPAAFPDRLDGYLVDRIEKGQSWLAPAYCRDLAPGQDDAPWTAERAAAFDAAWEAGIRSALARLRAAMDGREPGRALFGNSFGAYRDLTDGAIYEGLPTNWSDEEPLSYADWAGGATPFVLGEEGYVAVSGAKAPNYSLAETYEYVEWFKVPAGRRPYEKAGWTPSYHRMRFGLCTALLGDGWFSYEISTEGHGALGLLWFDEYDNCGEGRGYLGKPLGPMREAADLGAGGKVFRRDFERGIALCNPTAETVAIDLEGEFRSIAGKQDPTANPGTPARRIELGPRDGRILLR